MANMDRWAEAIARRISDEWPLKEEFEDDAVILRQVLAKALKAVPAECGKLIGTGVIEEAYFEDTSMNLAVRGGSEGLFAHRRNTQQTKRKKNKEAAHANVH